MNNFTIEQIKMFKGMGAIDVTDNTPYVEPLKCLGTHYGKGSQAMVLQGLETGQLYIVTNLTLKALKQ